MPAQTRPQHRPGDRIEIQLPWWSVALPAIAFAALLLLLLNPADAHAASGGSGVTEVFGHLEQAVRSRGL
ncbi:hypothetical protein HUT18_04555 [Streptomyces sp. NA04227]|uniref:hypothetical protein n=1 Tax=Streptomyces sp. NA04227 TaxID=2742136 RepID=UPI00158FF679|nr:hypothetical protein [Streptomyces sp. NA04227]QKW05754.1 hypothetical protein HUT18_04555 [Streptomyces sp. NA04227]